MLSLISKKIDHYAYVGMIKQCHNVEGRKIMAKKCPFNFDECSEECALFIHPMDLNDLVASRLTSIGVYDKQNGMCAFKNQALAQSRDVFEKSRANKF